MPEVVLATLNAKFIHAAFGLRYLRANLGPLRDRSVIREFDINTRPLDIAEALLEEDPRIIGLGVYIWNVTATTELVSLLKRIRPEVIIVLGGPEVSHETEGQPIVDLADYVVIGEGEVAFRALCESLLTSQRRILTKTLQGGLPPLGELQLPYDEYTAADCAHRLIYVEASRGCPFKCEFCLSSLDEKVRQFPLPSFLAAMQQLFDRGVRHFKFVDRTFNLNIATSRAILQFFLDHMEPGLFVHFELIPDRLPDSLLAQLGTLLNDRIPVDTVVVAPTPGRARHLRVVADPQGLAAQRYDAAGGAVYLLRPDQHVAARWRQFDLDAVRQAVGHATCNS